MSVQTAASSPPPGNGRLNGWKEIASFLGRGVRTVQRWEKTLGLPVHRITYEHGDIVFAFKSEIQSWQHRAEGQRAMAEPRTADGRASRRRRVTWLAIGSSAAVILVALASWQRGLSAVPVGVARQVTAGPGWESRPTISPDGGVVAYVSDEGASVDLWVVSQQGGEPLRLTNDAAREGRPTWFPDGSALAFASIRAGQRGVWKVPRFGGTPSLLLANAEDPAISPDGRLVAFARAAHGYGRRIFVASLSDPAGARAITGEQDGLWNHEQPTWSPDGATVCYAAGRDLWTVPVAGGGARRLTTDGEYDREPWWSPDGRHVYFSSFRGGVSAIWRVPAGGGHPARVTSGSGPERFASVSKDGSRLAYATFFENANLVIHDMLSGSEREFGGSRDEELPALSPDGRAVVYDSDRHAGQIDLWYQRLAETGAPEGAPVQLTQQPGAVSHPSFSPDGRWVAYYRIVGGQRDLWIVPVPPGAPVQFTSDPALDIHPDWSPDGTEIVFASARSGSQHLWVAPVKDGRPAGPPRQLTSGSEADEAPAWSPDGSTIAFIVRNDRGGTEVWTIGAQGGEARPLTSGAHAERVAWDPASGQLLVSGYWDSDEITIRRVDPAVPGARPSEPLAHLGASPSWIDFSLSHDGRLLAFSRAVPSGHIWLFEARKGKY